MKTVDRKELYQALWQTPITALAATWSVDPTEIRKAAKILQVPRPKSGHWTRVAFGKTASEALPEPSGDCPDVFRFSAKTPDALLPEAVRVELAHFVRQRQGNIQAQRRHHPLVVATRKAFDANSNYNRHRDQILYPNFKMPHVVCSVTKATLKRALTLLDCILRCAEQLDVEFPLEDHRFKMKIGEEKFDFLIRERLRQVKIEPPPEEWYEKKTDLVPTGELEFIFETAWEKGAQYSWKDGKTRTLEDVVEKIVINIPRVAEAHRTRRLKFEAQHLEFERQARERRERQERQAREERRLASLLQGAE